MMKHLKYLKYLIKHKWYVFLFGMKLHVPVWRLIIHDWTKFLPLEWNAYADSFYGPWKYNERPQYLVDAFDRAWLHHIHRNPHHWQHWVLREDDGITKCLEMPEAYAREMLADWIGAGIAVVGKDNFAEWYANNKSKQAIHESTRIFIETLMRSKGYDV